jgi:hypothetical protein
VHIVAWVYAWVIQEKYTANPPSYDWTDSGFVEGFFVVLLWRMFSRNVWSSGINIVNRVLSASAAKLVLLSDLHDDG